MRELEDTLNETSLYVKYVHCTILALLIEGRRGA